MRKGNLIHNEKRDHLKDIHFCCNYSSNSIQNIFLPFRFLEIEISRILKGRVHMHLRLRLKIS